MVMWHQECGEGGGQIMNWGPKWREGKCIYEDGGYEMKGWKLFWGCRWWFWVKGGASQLGSLTSPASILRLQIIHLSDNFI